MLVNPLSLQYSLQLQKDGIFVQIGRVTSKVWSFNDLRHGFEDLCMRCHVPICGLVMKLHYEKIFGDKIPIVNGESVITMFKDMHSVGNFTIGVDFYLPTGNKLSLGNYMQRC